MVLEGIIIVIMTHTKLEEAVLVVIDVHFITAVCVGTSVQFVSLCVCNLSR